MISALAAGVPLVCVPQGRDQFDVARQVDLTGTGIVVGSEFVPGDLCDSVRIVLDDARYRVAAAEMSKSIAGHGGVQEAVAIIDRCRATLVSPRWLWQPQRDSNPCRHLERVVS